MKKILCLFLTILICLSFCSCASTDEGPTTPEKTEATADELAQAAALIKKAEDSIVNASSYQLTNWSLDYDDMECFFVDSKYSKYQDESDFSPLSDIYKTAKTIHFLRISAKDDLDKAKELIGKGGDSDYYNAVKEYYKVVNTFWNLISELPEGYSNYTFSTTVSDYKSKCSDAYSEVEFSK